MVDMKKLKGYEILPDGRILDLKGKEKKCWKSRGGYLLTQLRHLDGSRKQYLIHRLVATAYVPNPDNLPQVNHIDGDKCNNAASNLKWCDQGHNMKHSYASGLRKPTSGKLSDDQVKEMRRLREEGFTYQRIGDMFGISYQSAHLVCTKKQYSHVGD